MDHIEFDDLPEAQKKAAVAREVDGLLWTLDMIQAGLAVRRAGLIWLLPLCHDSYGENI